jgi:hypothetical protein
VNVVCEMRFEQVEVVHAIREPKKLNSKRARSINTWA